MEKKELIREAKAKKVFSTGNDDFFIQEFQDYIPAKGGREKIAIARKGICNNKISAACFQMLHSNGVGSHFVKLLGEREMQVKRLEILPLTIVVRSAVSEAFSKRSGLPEGEVLPICAVEYYLDENAMIDPITNYEHIKIASSISEGEASYLRARAVEINSLLKMFFEEKGLILADVIFEFGKDKNSSILIGDEISLDTCTIWDRETHEKLDKERFRRDLGGVEEDYLAALKRVTGETI